MKQLFSWLVNYVQAGLDESILKFFWGLVATVAWAAISFTYHHLTGNAVGFLVLVYGYVHATSPVIALASFYHWAKTTAEQESKPVVSPAPSVSEPSALPVG